MASNDRDASIIPPAVSDRMCTHMNDDHAVSVFAMAKAMVSGGGWTLSQLPRLTSITEHGATLQVTLCRNVHLCKRETILYPFDPPLTNANEARKRLVAIHHVVTQPITWYRKPLALVYTAIVIALAYGALVMGTQGMLTALETRTPFLLEAVASDALTVAKALRVWFAIAMMGHLVVSTYVAYHCMKTLKLKPLGTALWYLSVLLGGCFPLFEFQELLLVQTSSTKKKMSKDS